MAIHTWHWGKLVILWTWGVVCVGLMLVSFLEPISESPGLHWVELILILIILVGLSVITWRWLGAKEGRG
jgi:hypothetical protein